MFDERSFHRVWRPQLVSDDTLVVVLSARLLDAPAARAALGTLCRQYWYPIYAFIRCQSRSHHEGEDPLADD